MNQKFDELQLLCNSTKKDKGSILETAKERLSHHNEKMMSVLQQINPVAECSNLMELDAKVEDVYPMRADHHDAELNSVQVAMADSLLAVDGEKLVSAKVLFTPPIRDPVPMAHLSSFGSFIECNESFAHLFNVNACQLAGSSLFSLVPDNELTTLYTSVEQLLNSRQPSHVTFSCMFGIFWSRCILSSLRRGYLQLILIPSRTVC
jgi:hypothetical protein